MNDASKNPSWDERYNVSDYVYGTDPNEYLVEVADRIPKGPVLCLAEGEGRNAVYLAEQGYEVTAVDSSSVGLEKARKLARVRSVTIETIHADLADFEIGDERWAGIVSIFCHLPAELRRLVCRRCVDGLRPGGAVVMEAYTPRQISYGTGGPQTVDLLVDPEDVKRELSGLQLERAVEKVREINEGRYHCGAGAVVQILGFKNQGR
jgi:SAM-dependent methyltransferase